MTLTWTFADRMAPARSWRSMAGLEPEAPKPHGPALLDTLEATVRGGACTLQVIAESVRMPPREVGWRLLYLKKLGRLQVTGRSVDARWSGA